MNSDYNRRDLKNSEHKCQLPPEEDVLGRYISVGYCIGLRRWFKKSSMVCATNPRSRMYLKSNFGIRREKIRHLEEHYYMIHPFSSCKCYCEFVMIFVMLISMVISPVMICMHLDVPVGIKCLKWSLNALCMADMILVFNTGYQDSKTKLVILSRLKVTVNYLKTRFIPDLFSIYIYINILRIFSLITYMNRFQEYSHCSLFKFKILKLVVIMLLLLEWATCGLFIIANQAEEPWLVHPITDDDNVIANLLLCFVEIFDFFLLLDYRPPTSLYILAFEMAALAVGVIVQMFVLSQVMQGIEKYKTSENKYTEKKQELSSYVHIKQVPNSIMRRCQNYFDFKFQKSYYKESEIIQTLSPTIRSEINYHICEKLLENLEILKDMPISVLMNLIDLMEREIYLPNDIIVRAGDIGNSMYFISAGMVAVYTPGGKEICHISTGGNFGEVCLTMEHASRVATVVAVDYCDLYVLSRKNFLKVIETQPNLYRKTMEIAKKRMTEIVEDEHTRNRPIEFFDMRTPEGVYYFKKSLYNL